VERNGKFYALPSLVLMVEGTVKYTKSVKFVTAKVGFNNQSHSEVQFHCFAVFHVYNCLVYCEKFIACLQWYKYLIVIMISFSFYLFGGALSVLLRKCHTIKGF
jgi:hypothetical protein